MKTKTWLSIPERQNKNKNKKPKSDPSPQRAYKYAGNEEPKGNSH